MADHHKRGGQAKTAAKRTAARANLQKARRKMRLIYQAGKRLVDNKTKQA